MEVFAESAVVWRRRSFPLPAGNADFVCLEEWRIHFGEKVQKRIRTSHKYIEKHRRRRSSSGWSLLWPWRRHRLRFTATGRSKLTDSAWRAEWSPWLSEERWCRGLTSRIHCRHRRAKGDSLRSSDTEAYVGYMSRQSLARGLKSLSDGIDRRFLSFDAGFSQFPIDDLHVIRHGDRIARSRSETILVITSHKSDLSVGLLSYLSDSYFCTADFGRTLVWMSFCTAGCVLAG